MKHLFAAAALLAMPAAFAQTATPSSTDQTTRAAQTTGDSTTSPAQTPAPAAAAKPTVGATVYGSAGTPVGTIKAMDAQFVTLTTAKGDIRLPATGVGAGPSGPTIALTAEQLDAAIDQAKAAQPVASSKTTSAATTETSTTTAHRSRTRHP